MDALITTLGTIIAAVISTYIAYVLRRRDRITAFAVIKGVSFLIDCNKHGKCGLSIFVDLSLCNVAGAEFAVIAYFSHAKGMPLQDSNGAYRTYDNQVATYHTLRPSTNEEIYRGVELWIPYDELHLDAGRHDLSFYLSVVRESTGHVLSLTGRYLWTYSQA